MAIAHQGTEDLERVQVNVLAEDEDGQVFHWCTRLSLQQPLLPLRMQWASAHGLAAAAAVGFEDAQGMEVDLQRTPAELGWNSSKIVHLNAIPVDEKFAAPDNDENVPPPSTVVAVPARTHPRTRTEPSEVHKRARTEPSEAVAADGATSDRAAGEPCLSAPLRSGEPVTSMATKDSGGSNDDDPIVFLSDNPKRPGTATYERYEKYKGAKTRREAMQLGASRADIVHDFKKGFFKKA